jgi:hypothetical protein
MVGMLLWTITRSGDLNLSPDVQLPGPSKEEDCAILQIQIPCSLQEGVTLLFFFPEQR